MSFHYSRNIRSNSTCRTSPARSEVPNNEFILPKRGLKCFISPTSQKPGKMNKSESRIQKETTNYNHRNNWPFCSPTKVYPPLFLSSLRSQMNRLTVSLMTRHNQTTPPPLPPWSKFLLNYLSPWKNVAVRCKLT